ncbi:Ankyrin repeat-containing protein [Artemisia annua]|uniref:Ankyrin repeat-containing protein n=1 Tax=Artemisia annua TaxID=35608 RepID=A0A2U1PE47_ARTAN|nr:Ankyrin repeat-containing protein [Artemisia annua]
MADASGMTPELEQQHVLTDESINALGPDPEQEIRPEPTRVAESEIEPEPQPQLEQEQIHTQGPEPTQESVDALEEVLPQEPVPQPGPEQAQEQGQQTPLNLPLQDLFKGEWDVALGILERADQGQDYSYLLRYSITDNCETALHVAASAQNTSFVRNLVDKMKIENLRYYQNLNGNTALCLAAMTGNVEIAKIMVDSDRDLLTICNKNHVIPLYIAALYGKRDMVTYLYNETNRDEWTYMNNKWVFTKCVEADLFDIALNIFKMHPEVISENEAQSVLGVLARKPSAFNEKRRHTMWRIVSSTFISFPAKTTLLDDLSFYENREKLLKARRTGKAAFQSEKNAKSGKGSVSKNGSLEPEASLINLTRNRCLNGK